MPGAVNGDRGWLDLLRPDELPMELEGEVTATDLFYKCYVTDGLQSEIQHNSSALCLRFDKVSIFVTK